MSIWTTFTSKLKELNEAIESFDGNPYLSHAIDWLGDYIMGQHFLKKEQGPNGKTVRTVNHQWFRREAPHIFAESHLDENVLREILYARDDHGDWLLKTAWRTSLLDRWGPSVPNPDPALGEVGRNQWNDIRLSIVSEMFKDPEECNVPLTGGERKQKIEDICATLTEIAKLNNVYKLRRFVRMNYCKLNEGDYRIVRFERFRHEVFTSIQGFFTGIRNWATDPGPTGFRNMATFTAAGIDVGAHMMESQLNNATMAINRRANRLHPRGFLGWIVGR